MKNGVKFKTLFSGPRDCGFKSRHSNCDYRIKVITSDCGSEDLGSIPNSHLTQFKSLMIKVLRDKRASATSQIIKVRKGTNKMKFYSEFLNKLYNSEEELIKAETTAKEAEEKRLEAEKIKKATRVTKAKEVEKALKEANEAQNKAIKMLKDFTNEYGYFHTSFSTDNVKNNNTDTTVNYFYDLVTSFLQ